MSEKYSLAQASEAIRYIISFFEQTNKDSPLIVEAAHYGLSVIEYLSTRDALVKAAIRMDKKHPELGNILKAFPNSKITNIREIKNEEGKKT